MSRTDCLIVDNDPLDDPGLFDVLIFLYSGDGRGETDLDEDADCNNHASGGADILLLRLPLNESDLRDRNEGG